MEFSFEGWPEAMGKKREHSIRNVERMNHPMQPLKVVNKDIKLSLNKKKRKNEKTHNNHIYKPFEYGHVLRCVSSIPIVRHLNYLKKQ